MPNISTLSGPGYSVSVPKGFQIFDGNPFAGAYVLLPRGSHPSDIPAIVTIGPIRPFDLPMKLQTLYNFNNPNVSWLSSMNLGIANITGMLPVRQVNIDEGIIHILEFEGITIRGFPVRVMVMEIEGSLAAVEVVVMVNLYRWIEFLGPCLEFVGGINLSGTKPMPGHVQALIDNENPEQIEYQLVNSDDTVSPLTAFPTYVENLQIINMTKSN